VFIRYNAVAKIWEYDSTTSATERAGDPRAVWLPLPIDYSQLVNVPAIPPAGVWQGYVPAWITNGVQPAIGNGNIGGQYSVVGKTVNLNIFFQSNTTTVIGTGIWGFSLPVPIGSPAYIAGNTFIYNSVLGTQVIGGVAHGNFFLGGAFSNSIIIPTPTGLVTDVVPFNWAANSPNYIFLQLTYQSA